MPQLDAVTSRPGRPWILAGGVLLAALAFALAFALAGAALNWAHATQRDRDGYYTSPAATLETTGYALVSEGFDLQTDAGEHRWNPLRNIGTARVTAQATKGPGRQVLDWDVVDFVDLVVPELQARGRYKKQVPPRHLPREGLQGRPHLSPPHPASRHR